MDISVKAEFNSIEILKAKKTVEHGEEEEYVMSDELIAFYNRIKKSIPQQPALIRDNKEQLKEWPEK
jgi:hypothetical protein